MADREKVVEGLEKLRKDLGYGLPDRSNVVMEYLNSLTNALAMLKEQDDMISITTIAEFLADWATPPPTAERWERVMMWERFLLDLKGRKTGND